MGTVKDSNGKDLIEAQEIKKTWQEYTEELYKNVFNDLDNHDNVITHLQRDILKYEVKWVLGSTTRNKASRCDRIPAKLFQILKDDVVQVLCSIRQQIGKLSSGHRFGKGQFSFQSQRKDNAKECSNYNTTVLISHVSKIMFKILQTILQQCKNQELPDLQAGIGKGRGTRD